MIVLDTQVLVWMAFGIDRLGSGAKDLIEREPDRRISSMVEWELAMLLDKQRLTLDQPLEAWMKRVTAEFELAEVNVTGTIARDAGSLPGNIHGDPCDRIIIATSRRLVCPLITADRAILDYAEAGHIRVIDARH